MAISLAGKTAIVTGAGSGKSLTTSHTNQPNVRTLTWHSGINFAFAKSLLSKRCNVIFADLALRPEAQEIVSNHTSPSQSPARAVFQHTDVREWQHLERMFHVATKEFGGADIVCPGAGVFEPPFSNFWHPPGSPQSRDPPTSNRYALLDINLTHPIRTTQLALSHFLSQSPKKDSTTTTTTPPHPPKSILHISSIAGQTTPLPAPIYNATKHALNGFVRSLSPLHPHLNILVTAVAPGVIRTPLWTEHPEKLRMISEADEWVSPEDVANVMTKLVEGGEVEVVVASSSNEADDDGGKKMVVRVEGGMILEVAKGRVRVVKQFMDEGPGDARGSSVGNKGVVEEEIFRALGSGKWGV